MYSALIDCCHDAREKVANHSPSKQFFFQAELVRLRFAGNRTPSHCVRRRWAFPWKLTSCWLLQKLINDRDFEESCRCSCFFATNSERAIQNNGKTRKYIWYLEVTKSTYTSFKSRTICSSAQQTFWPIFHFTNSSTAGQQSKMSTRRKKHKRIRFFPVFRKIATAILTAPDIHWRFFVSVAPPQKRRQFRYSTHIYYRMMPGLPVILKVSTTNNKQASNRSSHNNGNMHHKHHTTTHHEKCEKKETSPFRNNSV